MSYVPDLPPGTLELLILKTSPAAAIRCTATGLPSTSNPYPTRCSRSAKARSIPRCSACCSKAGSKGAWGRVREQPPRQVLHADRGRQETAGGRTPGIRPADRRDSQGPQSRLEVRMRDYCSVVAMRHPTAAVRARSRRGDRVPSRDGAAGSGAERRASRER